MKSVIFSKVLINTCVFKGFAEQIKKTTNGLLPFWCKTGVPDDAKMSQEKDPDEQADSKNKEIKKEKKEEKRERKNERRKETKERKNDRKK